LEWTFKWREALESGIYYERLLPGGFIKPEDAQPYLGPLDFYTEAFTELGTCRPVGMALAPIPFTAIIEYSRLYELDDIEEFAYLMRLMDGTFMRLSRIEQSKGDNASRNGNPQNNDKR
jgi:hypothetical protein